MNNLENLDHEYSDYDDDDINLEIPQDNDQPDSYDGKYVFKPPHIQNDDLPPLEDDSGNVLEDDGVYEPNNDESNGYDGAVYKPNNDESNGYGGAVWGPPPSSYDWGEEPIHYNWEQPPNNGQSTNFFSYEPFYSNVYPNMYNNAQIYPEEIISDDCWGMNSRNYFLVDTSKDFNINKVSSYFENLDVVLIDPEKMVNKDIKDIDEIICAVCFCIMNNPQTLKCEHTFCMGCLNNLYKNNVSTCPLCRTNFSLNDLEDNSKLKNMIDTWMFNCENCNKCHQIGNRKCANFSCKICKMTVSYDRFLKHLENNCAQGPIIKTCKLCNLKVFASHFDSHKLTCVNRVELCTFCSKYIAVNKMNTHAVKCREELSMCEKCNKKIHNKTMDIHKIFCEPMQQKHKIKDQKNISRPRQTNTKNDRLNSIKERLRKKLSN